MLEKIYLVDSNPALVDAWKNAFSEWPEVEPIECDFFEIEADTMVSPANSFGYMDGELDLAIRYELGEGIESAVQALMLERYHGEMPYQPSALAELGLCSNNGVFQKTWLDR